MYVYVIDAKNLRATLLNLISYKKYDFVIELMEIYIIMLLI